METLVSFCLITYNQEKYILEALQGAVSQTYTNLEIVICDDASVDNTQEIIKDFVNKYKGKHKIILNFNDVNVGLTQNVNKAIYKVSNGDYIFLAAGDDISRPDRVEKCMQFFEKNPEVITIGTALEVIDDDSQLSSIHKFISVESESVYDIDYYLSENYRHLYGCTRAFNKKITSLFPPLNDDCPTEDTTLLFRSFLCAKVGELPDALVKYRIHGNNMSSSENLKKMNINAIFTQYEDDLDFAHKNNYFPKSKLKIIKKVLEERKRIRMGTNLSSKTDNKVKLFVNILKKMAGR